MGFPRQQYWSRLPFPSPGDLPDSGIEPGISAVIFLVSANYSLLTVLILDQVEDNQFGVASAFSTILILIVYIAIVIIKLMLNRLGSNPQKSEA